MNSCCVFDVSLTNGIDFEMIFFENLIIGLEVINMILSL